ncbi:hypothetical protein [Bacillus sp. FJAT-49736]|uniref:stalk domain-containing protein n=1 Tax=Bacillus sp. FJAT-49736 TaxID=2833582 RepID=UPI001BC9B960|nr:hypothetical protein [Bacillus sp. FJAT-49736]MBS4172401.1 hypothetical protein [Bacillus sp. FJAT-49736]
MRKTGNWKLSVFILTAVLVSVIFFQWRSFSSEENKEELPKVDIDSSIKHQNNYFTIYQTIHQLSPNTYEVIFPKNIKNVKCSSDSGKKCTWSDAKKSKIKINGRSVTFSYTIDRKASTDFYLLKDWSIQLKNVQMDKVKIQLSESQFQYGTWIAGGHTVAVKHLDFIDYYVFDSKGDIPALLWRNKKLMKMEVNNWFTIYHSKDTKIPDFDLNVLQKMKELPAQFIFYTDKYPTEQIGSLIILNKRDTENLNAMIVQSQIKNQYHFPKGEEWFREVIAACILERPIGSEKAQQMYEQLVKTLSQEELKRLSNEIVGWSKATLNDQDLDLLLQRITGYRTNFFHENNNEKSPLQNLLLLDPHLVKWKDQEMDDINIILQNGKRMYPLEKMLTVLGYTVKQNGSFIEVEKPNQLFQFRLNSHIFYYNNEKYGVLTNPISSLNQQYYIEENWLTQLFNIKIKVSDKEIHVLE